MSNPSHEEILRVPSVLDRLPDVDAAVESVATEMGFDQNARTDFGICVTEAAANAMVHAHHQRPELEVEIRFEKLPDALRISVRDFGDGFDPDRVPDPTLPENLLKESGRGLHLIRSLMDEVHVYRHRDGMQIVMMKKLPPS
ncbi:ATP-binding protein [bacterium]|nr:ATP-binding protein [bacterium]